MSVSFILEVIAMHAKSSPGNYGDPTTNLFNAIKLNRLDIAKEAIRNGARLGSQLQEKTLLGGRCTPAMMAASNERWDILSVIVNSTIDTHGAYRFESALIIGIIKKSLPLAVAKQLLNHLVIGKDYLAWAGSDNNKALHLAVKENWPEMVALLFHYGCQQEHLKNHRGETPCQINEVCYLKGWEMWYNERNANSLFEGTLTPQQRYDGNPATNLHNAIKLNRPDLAKEAIEQGANLELPLLEPISNDQIKSWPPAMIAAYKKHWEVLSVIANSKTDENGSCRFESALVMGIPGKQIPLAVAKQLLNHLTIGKDCYARLEEDCDLNRALHLAVQENWPEMVALLLYYGYPEETRNHKNQQPRQLNEACYLAGWEILQNSRHEASRAIIFLQGMRQKDSILYQLPFEFVNQLFLQAQAPIILNDNNHLKNQRERLAQISVKCLSEEYSKQSFFNKTNSSNALISGLRESANSFEQAYHIRGYMDTEMNKQVKYSINALLEKFHLFSNNIDAVIRVEPFDCRSLLLKQIALVMQVHDENFKGLNNVDLVNGQMIMHSTTESDISMLMVYCAERGLSAQHINNYELALTERSEIDYFLSTICKISLDIYEAFPDFNPKSHQPEESRNCIIC